MPDRRVLDLSRLEEAFEDDREGIAEILELAMETGSAYERALADAVAAGDVSAASRAAHSIKGSASNVGAGEVTRVAAAIEDRARAGSLAGAPALVAELEGAYAALRVEVRRYRETL